MKKLLSMVAFAAIVLGFASCNKPDPTNPEIRLDKTLTMYVGQELKLLPEFIDCDSLDADLYWESNDEDVVTVDQKGKLTALKKGEAKVTVTYDKYQISASCRIEVKEDEFYLAIDKTNFKLGEKAAFEGKMRSGKPLKDKVVYALYLNDSEKALSDSICRDSCTFLAYAPGKFKLVATAGAEKDECELTVEGMLPELKANTDAADAAKLTGSWKLVSASVVQHSFLDGVSGDSTYTYTQASSSAAGISFLNDSLCVSLKDDYSLKTDTSHWNLKDGYLRTGISLTEESSVIALAIIFMAFDSDNLIVGLGLNGLSTTSLEGLTDAVDTATDGHTSPVGRYAFSFNAKGQLVLHTFNEMAIIQFNKEKEGVPAHYTHADIVWESQIVLEKL